MPDRRFVDLHTHSTASDGACPPADVAKAAEQAQLAAFALTDHDTIAGLAEAAQAAQALGSLRFIGGIEISAIFRGGTMHLLGLGLDVDSPNLAKLMADMQAAREHRDPQMIARLQQLGVQISMDDVLAAAQAMGEQARGKRLIGRVHFAEALRRKGYVQTIGEAFDRYIGNDAPAYVDKERLTPRQAIEGIHASGGLAVLAHPVSLGCENRLQLERVVRELAGWGLDGIEAYHSDHDEFRTRMVLELARRLGLGVSGGSDFHGSVKPGVSLGRPRVPLAALSERFRRHLGL